MASARPPRAFHSRRSQSARPRGNRQLLAAAALVVLALVLSGTAGYQQAAGRIWRGVGRPGTSHSKKVLAYYFPQ